VVVSLINLATKQSQSLKLFQTFGERQSAGLMTDDLK